MGGRGSSSNMAKIEKAVHFDASTLTGSEKQKSWAQDIVDNALNTIDSNIKRLTETKIKVMPQSKEEAEIYKLFRGQIVEQLKKFKSASQVIDYRDTIDPRRINEMVNFEYNRRKLKKR